MALNMKTLTQALARTAAVIEKTVQTTVQEVTGPKALQDYDLVDQIGSGGPALAWKIFTARPRPSTPSQYSLVSVWILDKRAISEARSRAGISKAAEDAFFDIIRADAARLVRLRHPGVIHVVQALDENKNAMAMVTEPLFASVANTLGMVDNIDKLPKELKGMEMGLLEIKHGLLQIAESLDFLHNNARLLHRAISPETVYITSSGAWKLGGFGFTISLDQISDESSNVQSFHYSEYDVDDSVVPLQPSLDYTAPELVRSKVIKCGFACDIFSLGCLVYHLVARKPLLDCHNNVKMYTNRLAYLSNEVFSSIPPDLITDLRQMLSMDDASRPSALNFTGSSFFRDDTRLRALRFLDHMLERDNMQKSEFLKALSDMWKDFDSRVLRYKVLPPLCAELRNVVMQPMILPMVLTIAESQDKNDFELSTLPPLIPVLSSAVGETLLLLVKHAELIINKTSQEYLIAHVLPMLVRAYDDTDSRIQEEVLRRTVSLSKQLDPQLLKQAILPRVHGLALKTTVAAVRVNALLCLAELVHSLDKRAVLMILQTLQRCTAVDRSAPTLMCTLGVANSIFKQYELEFTAEHVLPLLLPLLLAQQLNVQQFAKFMLFVKDILRKIEEKRGITVTDSGYSDVKLTPSVVNGLHLESFPAASVPASSSKQSSSTWDEDWGPTAKAPSTAAHSFDSSSMSKPTMPTAHSTPLATTSWQSSTFSQHSVSNQQNTSSCPAVDIEWPPSVPPSSSESQFAGISKSMDNSMGSADTTFDDLDPFADWPPQLNNSVGGSGLSAISRISSQSTSSSQSGGDKIILSNTAFASKNPTGLFPRNQSKLDSGVSSKQSDILNSSIPVGSSRQRQGSSNNLNGFSLGNNSSANGFSKAGLGNNATDLASIFVSSKSVNPTPKLAPPPSAGRGRVRVSPSASSRTSQAKPPSEKPPLLDLL